MTAAARRRINASALPFSIRRFRAADLALADGAAVSSWADTYGSGTTATQATGSKQPTYVASSSMNSRPAVRFDGTDDSLRVDSLASWFTGADTEHTIFVVADPNDTTSTRTLVGAGRSTNTIVVLNYRLNGGAMEVSRRGDSNETIQTDTAATNDSGAAKIYTYRRKGRAVGAWSNGTIRMDDYARDNSTMTVNQVAIGSLARSTDTIFFSGDIADVVIVQGALSTYYRTLIETQLALEYGMTLTQIEADYPERIVDNSASWWSLPRAVASSGKTYVGGVSRAGTVEVAELGGVGRRWAMDTFTADDHNTPAILAVSGKPPVAFWNDHSGSLQGLNWRKATNNDDFTAWGARQRKTFSAAGQTAYVQAYNRPGTDEVVIFSRVSNNMWHVMRSTDYAATFATSISLIDFTGTNQGYMATRQLADGTLRVVSYGHPVLSTFPDIYYWTIDLATGDVKKLDGTTIGNIISGTSLPLAPSSGTLAYDVTTGGSRLFDISDATNPEIAFATWTTDNNTMYRYTRWTGSAWEPHDVVASGVAFGLEADTHYVGGMSFPAGSPGGVVYLSRESSGGWTVEKAETSDGGSNWARTVLSTAPAGRKYIRPYALATTDPHPLVHVDLSHYGTDGSGYTDYAGDLMLPQASVEYTAPLYVDPANTTGVASDSFTSDQNDSTHPWLTLGKAISSAPANALVRVMAWTNSLDLTVTGALRDDPVTFEPAPAATVQMGIIRLANCRNVIFDGLTFQRWVQQNTSSYLTLRNSTVIAPAGGGGGAVSLSDANNVLVEDCDLQQNDAGTAVNCINFGGSVANQYVTIRRCLIHNVDSGDGIQVKRPHQVVIEDCEFYDFNRNDPASHQDGIQTLGHTAGNTGLTIRRNHFHGPNTGGIQCMLLTDCAVPGLVVENNLIAAGWSSHYITFRGQPDAVIRNNTVVTGSIRADAPTSGTTVGTIFNNIVGNTIVKVAGSVTLTEGYNLAGSYSGLTKDATSQTGAATFVDAAGEDYHLNPASAGVDDGAASLGGFSAPAEDLEGTTRTGTMDLGCYTG